MVAVVWMVLPLALGQSPVPLVSPDEEPPPPVVRVEEAPGAESARPSGVRVGAALEAGLPSGLALTPFVRPISWLQVEGSLAYDGAAFGLGGGLTLGALDWPFTPTLSASAGHFFRGDLSGSLSQISGVDVSRYQSARSFDFDHADLQLGLLVGGAHLQFFLRGGVSWVHAVLHDFQASLRTATGDTSLTAADPTLTAWVPSGRAGLQVVF